MKCRLKIPAKDQIKMTRELIVSLMNQLEKVSLALPPLLFFIQMVVLLIITTTMKQCSTLLNNRGKVNNPTIFMKIIITS